MATQEDRTSYRRTWPAQLGFAQNPFVLTKWFFNGCSLVGFSDMVENPQWQKTLSKPSREPFFETVLWLRASKYTLMCLKNGTLIILTITKSNVDRF